MKALVPRRWVPPSAFERACLALMQAEPGRTLSELQRHYVDFALSTNERGVQAVGAIARVRPVRGARCLDVGCAYGGFLVALGWRGAGDLVGIDLDARLLRLARVNLADHGIVASLRIADVQDEAAVEALGRFDVVVCNSVLEHVTDVAATIRHLCRLTGAGGLVYVVVPNRNHPHGLVQDEHYHLQGLTLLAHRDAERYHAAMLGHLGPYGVCSHRPLRYYLHHFRRHGLAVEVLAAPAEAGDLDRLRKAFEHARERFDDFRLPPAVPAELTAKISRRFTIVHGTFSRMIARYDRARQAGDPAADAIGEAVRQRFGMEEWTLVARRPVGYSGS